MIRFLRELLGDDAVIDAPDELAPYREDATEAEPADPSAVAFVTRVEQIQAIVHEAARRGVAITPRVAGTNVAGLTIPAPGGVVLDMTRMDRVIDVDEANMIAVIEPGVTQQSLADHLAALDVPLTFGFSLAPPHTSVLANALLGGLTNRSLKYGDQSQWIAGLEVVRADGTLLRTGAWALSDVPFARMPFPDLTGLFTGFAGTTGIVTKMAFSLWPRHPLQERLMILSYDLRGTFAVMKKLCRAEICDDIGGLSWPSGKMILGVPHPDPVPIEGEPCFFLYVDLTAETSAEMAAKREILASILDAVRSEGARFDDPIDVETLVRVDPQLGAFARFPTELTFLTQAPGGGLTWVGTYGPLSRIEDAAQAVMDMMTAHGVPPLLVTRPMRGGHFVVLRMIQTFDKADPSAVARVSTLNAALLQEVTARGYVMYKLPAWAWQQLRSRVDPGMRRLIRETRSVLDPLGIFNPGKLPV